MASHLGYEHVRKTPESPATLAIYEPEAAVVRTMFEKFATGDHARVENLARAFKRNLRLLGLLDAPLP
jgi:hypothetical protein